MKFINANSERSTTFEESRLRFVFSAADVVKFDEDDFYRKYATQLNGKGVDFLAAYDDFLFLLEVKNFSGSERENRWRTVPQNRKRQKTEDGESLDVETARKIAATVATLIGAQTFDASLDRATRLPEFLAKNGDYFTPTPTSKVRVVLVLEGNFNCQTRSFPMIARRLQESVERYLRWLNCRVAVVRSNVPPRLRKYFTATPVANDGETEKPNGRRY